MEYTKLGPKVDKKIQNYMDIIIDEIIRQIPQTKSIILGGGFGRGEGSVEIVGNKVIPLNDFDIFIVTEKDFDEEVLNNIANKAAVRLKIPNFGTEFYKFSREKYSNTFYIDLKNMTPAKLKTVPLTIKYYELKNASAVVYGKDYRPLMPNNRIKDISLTDGFRHLFNRMALLVEYFSTDYFVKNKISENEKKGLIYLGCSKAYMACAEALLLLNGKFVPSYEQRARVLIKDFKKDFPELSNKIPDFDKRLEQAIKFKLNSKFPKNINAFDRWYDACYDIGEVAKFFVSKYAKKKVSNYNQLSEIIYHDFTVLYFGDYVQHYFQQKFHINLGKSFPSFLVKNYMKLVFYLRLKKFRKINLPRILVHKTSPDLILFSILPRLLYSIDRNKRINKSMLLEAGKLINKIFPTKLNIGNEYELWNEIGDRFSQAYVLYCFLKIV